MQPPQPSNEYIIMRNVKTVWESGSKEESLSIHTFAGHTDMVGVWHCHRLSLARRFSFTQRLHGIPAVDR